MLFDITAHIAQLPDDRLAWWTNEQARKRNEATGRDRSEFDNLVQIGCAELLRREGVDVLWPLDTQPKGSP